MAANASASASTEGRPQHLLLFTTSQTPLPPRFPRPAKPVLHLPPLIHRSLHSALDQDPPSHDLRPALPPASSTSQPSVLVIPHPDTLLKHDVPAHSLTAGSAPSSSLSPVSPSSAASIDARNVAAQPETSRSALTGPNGVARSDELESEVTVKLHLIAEASPAARAAWVSEALHVLAAYKGLGQVDNLMVGFSGVDYKGKRSAAAEMFGCGAEGLEQGMGSEVVDPETAKGVEEVWALLGPLAAAPGTGSESESGPGSSAAANRLPNGAAHPDPSSSSAASTSSSGSPRIKAFGTLYLPLALLQTLAATPYPPRINALDTPDCHHLPREYVSFAREAGIELWAGGGGEGADPIPAADLHNLLEEFTEQLEVVAPGLGKRFGRVVPLRDDRLKYVKESEEGGERAVGVKWVLSYTLLSKTRNLVRDRGYIVSADFL